MLNIFVDDNRIISITMEGDKFVVDESLCSKRG